MWSQHWAQPQSAALLTACVAEVADADEFILGRRVARIEEGIAELAGVKYAVACASGADALLLALAGLDVSRGEIVMPSFTSADLLEAAAESGAVPVFADAGTSGRAMTAEAIRAVLSVRTTVLLLPDASRISGSVEELVKTLADENILVIGSAAPMPGATLPEYRGRTFRAVAHVFSLGPDSVFQGCAEAGMLVTDNEELAHRCRALRNHGQRQRFLHEYVGFNSRMDEIAAEFLLRRIGGGGS